MRMAHAGFGFLTTAMGANVNEAGIGEADDSGPAMNCFTNKPYDEDSQASVIPFRNYSAKLAGCNHKCVEGNRET